MNTWTKLVTEHIAKWSAAHRRSAFISVVMAVALSILSVSPARADAFSVAAYGLSLLTGFRINAVQTNAQTNQAISAYNKGVQLLRHGRAGDAIPRFQEALQIDPSLNCTYGALGCALVETGNDAEAFGMLERATYVEQNDGGNWFELALCAQHLHRHRDSYYAYKRFLSLEPNGKGADHARISVQILDHTYMASAQTIAQDRASNYLAPAGDHSLYRWPKERIPLKVFFRVGNGVLGYAPAFACALHDAFLDWTAGTSELIQFVFVNDEESADIVCSWTANKADLGKGCGGHELGVTDIQFDNHGNIKHAEIRLLTSVGEGVKTKQEIIARAKSVDLHEIGHSLGLQHSSESYDTMAPVAPPVGLEFPLTMRDRNTLLALYSLDQSALGDGSGGVSAAMSAPWKHLAESPEDACERLNSEDHATSAGW